MDSEWEERWIQNNTLVLVGNKVDSEFALGKWVCNWVVSHSLNIFMARFSTVFGKWTLNRKGSGF